MFDPQILKRLGEATDVDEAWLTANAPSDAKPAQPPPPAPPPLAIATSTPETAIAAEDLRNELADADRLVLDILGKAWFCPQRSGKNKSDLEAGWLVWDGKRLRPSEDGAIYRLAKVTAIALSLEYVAQAKEVAAEIKAEEACDPVDKDALKNLRGKQSRLLARADKIQSEGRMNGMISLARMDERLLIQHHELDANANHLNTQNGVVDLLTGTLLQHDPKHRCTKITAVPYLPKTDLTPVMKLLNRACMVKVSEPGTDGKPTETWQTDHDRVRYLQDAIGQALFGHQRVQEFYLCIGNGGDGKGTLFEALLDALGGGHDGYAMKADMQTFVKAKVSGHRIRDDLANMQSARIVLASEINKGEALDGALVKTLSGEDTQRVRHLFGKEFEFRPICSLFIQANHEPHVDSSDDAIWRRLVKIPFGPSLRADERDPTVRQVLHDPHTGGAALLAWAVAGAVRTANVKRLKTTESVSKATKAYRDDQNPLAGFLLDDLRFTPHAKHAKEVWVEQRAIRPAFEQWQVDTGVDDKRGPTISGKRIGAQLRACGAYPGQIRMGEKISKVWFGVTLRNGHPLQADHAATSVVPDIQDHLNQLARSGEVEITAAGDGSCNLVTSSSTTPDASAQNNIRPPSENIRPPVGNSHAHVRVGLISLTSDQIRENEVTRLQSKNTTPGSDPNSSPPWPNLDDLDDPGSAH